VGAPGCGRNQADLIGVFVPERWVVRCRISKPFQRECCEE